MSVPGRLNRLLLRPRSLLTVLLLSGLARAQELSLQDSAYVAALTDAQSLRLVNFDPAPLVEQRIALTGEVRSHAQRAIWRDLSRLAARESEWEAAFVHQAKATQLSRYLEEADELLADLLVHARLAEYSRQRGLAFKSIAQATDIASRLERHEQHIAALCLWGAFLNYESRFAESSSMFDRATRVPGADLAAILEKEINSLPLPADHPEARRRRVEIVQERLDLATAQSDLAAQAEARVALVTLHALAEEWPEAIAHWEATRDLQDSHAKILSRIRRDKLGQAYAKLGRLDAAAAYFREGINLAERSDFRDELVLNLAGLADVEHRRGNREAAYQLLRQAFEEKQSNAGTMRQFSLTSITPPTSQTDTTEAAQLAAVRNALRDAELARTQASHRQTVATATAASLLAVVLGLAYLLKRRAAANARLTAENAQLETLRYQLNPHLLFNSLANLNGLILTAPDKARVAVRRLSDFCRLALTRRESPLLPVSEEAERLRAYLDVAAAAEDDDLVLNCDVDPAAHATEIPPLLFQPLVENALKYADEDDTAHRRVTITIQPDSPTRLRIEITNTGPWTEATAATAKPSTGVGLTNLRARVAHAYPKRHTLTFTKTTTSVTATLTLQTG